ncbi:MAG: hypothetical protein K8F92_08740 [Hyphomicrobium sp.]|uniref:hypothetical protein n=1 Tax=Hyphomicrobium sp. TaxID=82 RepID=UPI00132B4A60|nr:hypothetical protein [Hyphomicrobium sp.]KAB2943552.1 MAG: hypothetical protein F9K20_02435 [Hyphomicrobium sp.]MBZ0209729.1 hypothetical protein [Hyphomicrobium sp.]
MTLDSAPQIPITALAFSLSAFLAITFLLCVGLGFLAPNIGTHALLQFFPRFGWTDAGIHHGLIESLAYGFYSAAVFGVLFNVFTRRSRWGGANDRSRGHAMSNI